MPGTSAKNPSVDIYLADGCGRCSMAATPACKVNQWRTVLKRLRAIALSTGLKEERKWGVPCYTYEGKNVIMLGAFKEYASIMFFKGALLEDTAAILTRQTENVQATRQIRITGLSALRPIEQLIKEYFLSAIALEKTGAKVTYKKATEYPVPEELLQAFRDNPQLKRAFYALTPGRQKGYLLYFAGAKQSQTRSGRITKHTQRILSGKGLDD
ncbi:MAG: hypothetical protein RL213_411 [Bacteroidota bacterium]|jgi:uncharacterized protein YdeI (YjbR/CyaY-like superfamily)